MKKVKELSEIEQENLKDIKKNHSKYRTYEKNSLNLIKRKIV
jgi:hypothetical protein